MIRKWATHLLKTYQDSSSTKIGGLLFAWLLLLSFWYSYTGLADFVPVLWKPIPPFEVITLTNPMMQTALWVWRVSLVIALLFPGSLFSLAAVSLLSFFCLGIRSCFGLQPQLFASLELTLIGFFLYSMIRSEKARGEELAFIVKLIAILLFFSAGLSKLRWSGIGWAFSNSLDQSFQMLYSLNRTVMAYPWILELREKFLENPQLIHWGSVVVLIFELLSPVALFSNLGSRIILFFSATFILANLIFFGILFYTIAPLLLIWGLWDVNAKQFFRITGAQQKEKIRIYTFIGILIFSQVAVSLFATKNLWPIMLNDMYARPSAFPPVTELEFTLLKKDGSSEIITENSVFSPFSKFHIGIALFRLKERADRDALLEKVLTNYKDNLCSNDCNDINGISATWTLKDKPSEVLASWMIH